MILRFFGGECVAQPLSHPQFLAKFEHLNLAKEESTAPVYGLGMFSVSFRGTLGNVWKSTMPRWGGMSVQAPAI